MTYKTYPVYMKVSLFKNVRIGEIVRDISDLEVDREEHRNYDIVTYRKKWISFNLYPLFHQAFIYLNGYLKKSKQKAKEVLEK